MQKILPTYFNQLSRLHIKETIGNYVIDINPIAFCTFNKALATNGQHLHHCYELCIVTDGIGEFLHGEHAYILNKGDVFIADPKVSHEIRITKNNPSKNNFLHLVFFNINIYGDTLLDESNYDENMIALFMKQHKIVAKKQDHILTYLDFIYHYDSYPNKNDYFIKNSVKNMALESLFSLVPTSESTHAKTRPDNSIVDTAMIYIGRHLTEKLYLDGIAKHVHTSIRNLQHLFQKHLNKSVTAYIKERRLAVAAGYLKMNFKVSHVCSLVGIHDPAQLSRLFKQYYGISPKKYQMLHASSGMVYGASYETNYTQGNNVIQQKTGGVIL